MRHSLISCLAALGALSGITGTASGQAVIERECSPQDIREALAGEYSGPPCRFTEMPEGVDAAPRRVAPQLAGAPPLARPASAPTVQASRPRIRTRAAEAPASREQVVPRAQVTPRAQIAPRETVRLDDSFFSGGLVGGVGRAPTVSYVYRGVIVIDGSGRVSTLAPAQITSAPVLRMDRRATLRTYPLGQ
ncbi:hypothetical protein [Maricaulis sp.]|uniref:hypothetical protein n=1 Tax=Maricaulis sp. TaxID=1486257 RepID=UPI003A8FC83F